MSFVKGDVISFYGLQFSFNEGNQFYELVDFNYDALDLVCITNTFFSIMEDVNIKGYVTLDGLNTGFVNEIASHLYSLGYERKTLGNNEIPFTYWYNFLFLNLYYLVVKKLKDHNFYNINHKSLKNISDLKRLNISGIDDIDSELEVLYELDVLKQRLYARLDQYIKIQIQKRGITIIENCYTAFDTEYECVNFTKNENRLISAQTAVQRRTILKVPCFEPFDIGYVHPLTSEISDTFSSKVDVTQPYKYSFVNDRYTFIDGEKIVFDDELERKKLNELLIINNSIKLCIKNIRGYLFKQIDSFLSNVIEELKLLKSVEGFDDFDFYKDDKRNQFVFFFPLTLPEYKIAFPKGSFNFLDLLEMSKEKIDDNKFRHPYEVLEYKMSKSELFKQGSFVKKEKSWWNIIGGYTQNVVKMKDDLFSFTNDMLFKFFRGGLLTVNKGLAESAFGFAFGVFSMHYFLFLVNLWTGTMYIKNEKRSLIEWYISTINKPKAMIKLCLLDDLYINLSIIRNNYIIAHYNTADLSMLSDFNEIKERLSIVGKSFVTLALPLRYDETFVYIRDTHLLSPGNMKSLHGLGYLYNKDGDFSKRDINKSDIVEMSNLLVRDKQKFVDYAMMDVKITIKHAIEMERFNRSVSQIGVPNTLSSIGRNFVSRKWKQNFDKHLPYQISGEYLMGNADEIQTPKGLFATRDVGAHMSYYIANYKGGRNESFMYGVDEKTKWYDYDLVSAYTTGMTDIPLPNYYDTKLMTKEEVMDLNEVQLMTGFLSVNCSFVFPEDTKYPSIPCYVDKTTTVYPLRGSSFVTGPEFLLAKQQGAIFQIKSAFYIAPKEQLDTTTNEMVTLKPFKELFKEIQRKRKEYPKGHFLNAMYKEIGNGIYGNVCRGISNKKVFDSLSKNTVSVKATSLSNPIIGSWTTAFIRSVIGECLHNIQELGGKVVSVTTDGFITDLDDLETKLLTLQEDKTVLLRKYRSLRRNISGDASALEIKSCGEGVISWTTRGQMGINSKIVATTGFQRGGYEKKELVELFKNTLSSANKFFEFTTWGLRSAKDIFEKGGHVIDVRKDQIFRLFHDGRRSMVEPRWLKKSKNFWDMSKILLDSKPLVDCNECKTLRFISKFPITLPYNKQNTNRSKSIYKTKLEVGVRCFIKAYYSTNETFGLRRDEFKRMRDLITFIYGHKPTKGVKISMSSISNLKNRKLVWKPVPNTDENLAFAEYIHHHLPHFQKDKFLKLN